MVRLHGEHDKGLQKAPVRREAFREFPKSTARGRQEDRPNHSILTSGIWIRMYASPRRTYVPAQGFAWAMSR